MPSLWLQHGQLHTEHLELTAEVLLSRGGQLLLGGTRGQALLRHTGGVTWKGGGGDMRRGGVGDTECSEGGAAHLTTVCRWRWEVRRGSENCVVRVA